MEVAVAEHVQWEREAAEEEEELQMRRHRRPENSAAVDISDVINGDSIEEEDEDKDSKSNHELSVPENDESKDELFVPENGHSLVSDYEEIGNVQSSPVNHQYQLSTEDDSLSDNKLLPAKKSIEDQKITQSSSGIIIDGIDSEVSKEGDEELNDLDVSLSDVKLLPIDEKAIEDPQITQFSTGLSVNDVDSEVLEDDEELKDLDVERVLKEQNTHHLFCPNCHSCITRKVILRKRKRSVKIFDADGKRNKPEIVDESQLDAISEHITDNQGQASQTPAGDENNRETEPEVFRCLACFTFFIPTGSGFKLFNLFGDKGEKENLQIREQTSSVKKNWLSTLFASRKEEILVDKDVEANTVAASEQEIHSSPSPLVASSSAEGAEVTGKVVANRGEKSDQVQKEAIEAVEPVINHSAALPGKGVLHSEVLEESTIFQQEGLKILAQTTTEASAMEKSKPDQKQNATIVKDADDKDWFFEKPLSVYGESENNKKMDLEAGFPPQNWQNIGVKQVTPIQSTVEVRNVEVALNDSSYACGFSPNNAGTKVDIHIEKTPRANADSFSSSLTTSLLLPETQVNITKDLMGVPQKASVGGDTIIIVTDKAQTATSQQAQDSIASAGTGLSALTEHAEDREFRGVEVIKSIVYGGLVESITSLGVVSSAAGSDTAIINIVALGLANLLGGLFVICHNLWDLKNDDHGVVYSPVTEDTPNQSTQRLDKYRDLLGRRENFLLHATVAILSYIIFGLIPPIIYGFSFSKSSDRDFKLVAVAVASLLCITVLAVAKVYVQRPPKAYIKTVFYYVILGFVASGASFVAGDLVEKLIEKLGWLSTGVDLSLPMIVESQGQPKWSFY